MTRVLYDKEMAPWYDELYVKNINTKKEIEFLDKIFKKHKVKKVLDVGCGTGRHSIPLKKLGYEVTGIDSSKSMLDHAKKKSEEQKIEIPFHIMDMRKIKLKQKFDAAIIMFTSFTYMYRNKDIINSLSSIRKVLKRGGILLIDVSNLWSKISTGKFKKETKKIIKKGNKKLEIIYKNEIDPNNPIVYLSGTFRRYEGKRKLPVKRDKKPRKLRIFSPDTFDMFFRLTGFKTLGFYGDYDIKTKLSKKYNRRLIVLAKKI